MDFAAIIAGRRARLEGLTAQRAALGAEGDALVALLATESRSALTPAEDARTLEIISQRADLQAQITAARSELDSFERDASIEEQATRAADIHVPVAPTPGLRTEERPSGLYRKNGPTSYLRDLALFTNSGDRSSFERLSQNNQETRAATAVDGSGGDFVPPAWALDDYAIKARPGRVVADNLEAHTLPAGTDSIPLPRITTGSLVDEQTTQNTALSENNIVSDNVVASVATIGGKQTVALQLLEQSPINMDEILFADLFADHARRTDVFCISNNAAGKYGLLNVPGLTTVTYTSGTPTVPAFLPKIISGAANIHTLRFAPGEKVFMTPNMWAWILAAQDTTGRPLVVPVGYGPYNAAGLSNGAVPEGLAGYISGMLLPVFLDANMPSNLGVGTNESHTIVAKTSDIHLFEGEKKAQAFMETKADQLSVVFRLYNYIALHDARFPASISKIVGTGTITPAL